MNYVIYARKSSESEDRQIQSIEDQLSILEDLAFRKGFNLLKPITESKSAKDPHSRQGFAKLLELIDSGAVDGILVWNTNRLYRNSVDFGEIQHRLQRSKLKSIETPERSYRPEDSMLLNYVEAGMSNQYVLDLSKVVLRGMRSKIEKGHWPHQAPEGYLNDLENHTIISDPIRLPLIRKAFGLLLTGAYTVNEVLIILNNDWNYRTKKHKQVGGNKLTKSAAYRIFSNIFYTGRMEIKGTVYNASHEAIITIEEFERVQEAIGRKAGYKSRGYAFNGVMKCVNCGRSIVGSFQKGRHGNSPAVYYHCGNNNCTKSKKSIREDRLEKLVSKTLDNVTWPAWYKEVILEELRAYYKQEYGEIESNADIANTLLSLTERKRSNLLDLKLDGAISLEDFKIKDSELRIEIENLYVKVKSSKEQFQQAWDTVNRVTDFMVYGQRTFNLGGPKKKQEIMAALGTEYTFDEGVVSIKLNPLLPIYYQKLEPQEIGYQKEEQAKSKSSVPLGWPFGTNLKPLLKLFKYAFDGNAFPVISFVI